MRISITTVYKSENPGSFLQAWALSHQLLNMGYDVCFRKYKYNNSFIKLVNFTKCCLRLRFKRAKDFIIKGKGYKRFQKMLKVSNDNVATDLMLFGSDTLWNFDDNFFYKNSGFFTGAGIVKPCYTYAISVASTSKDTILKNKEMVENIRKFKRIAVRDKHTEDILSEIYPLEKIVRTVDPTLLMDKEVYIEHFENKISFPKRFLAIYYFGDVPKETWEKLKSFALDKNLEIINLGLYGDREARSIVSYPSNFISTLANAEYIFTNTFHGCVFSTIFNKQFATDGVYKKKVEGFLEEFSLMDRVISSLADLNKVLDKSVDYERVNALVKEKRQKSVKYLEQCISEVIGCE